MAIEMEFWGVYNILKLCFCANSLPLFSIIFTFFEHQLVELLSLIFEFADGLLTHGKQGYEQIEDGCTTCTAGVV